MFSARNVDNAQLDIATRAHRHHEARQRIMCAVDNVPSPGKTHKEVFNRMVDGTVLIVPKVKDPQRGERVLLSDHCEEVTAFSKDFAWRCCVDAEFVAALEQAGRCTTSAKQIRSGRSRRRAKCPTLLLQRSAVGSGVLSVWMAFGTSLNP